MSVIDEMGTRLVLRRERTAREIRAAWARRRPDRWRAAAALTLHLAKWPRGDIARALGITTWSVARAIRRARRIVDELPVDVEEIDAELLAADG